MFVNKYLIIVINLLSLIHIKRCNILLLDKIPRYVVGVIGSVPTARVLGLDVAVEHVQHLQPISWRAEEITIPQWYAYMAS